MGREGAPVRGVEAAGGEEDEGWVDDPAFGGGGEEGGEGEGEGGEERRGERREPGADCGFDGVGRFGFRGAFVWRCARGRTGGGANVRHFEML